MKKRNLIAFVSFFLLSGCGNSSAPSEGTEDVVDMIGRVVKVAPGSYKKVVCIGAGALRLYSYVGDMNLLCGVEEIENEAAPNHPAMFDQVARPYYMANKDILSRLPYCGIGGPNAQHAEAEKILSCDPDIIISEYEDVQLENALQTNVGVPVITVRCGSGGVMDESFFGSMALLGKVFGKEERAVALTSYALSEYEAISNATADIPEGDKSNVYICGLGNWGTTNQFMTAQNYGSFNYAHINNVVTDLPRSGIQAIDEEKFVSLAPKMDVMVFDAAAVKNIKGRGFDFSLCKAFETGKVFLQMPANAYYINVEIALINTWFLAKSVYPERFLTIDIAEKANEITLAFNGKALYQDICGYRHSFGGYQQIANPTEFFQ